MSTAPTATEPKPRASLSSTPLAVIGKIVGLSLVAAVTLWMAPPLVATQNWGLLALLVISAVLLFAIYLQRRSIPMKYLAPGVFFLIIFQLVPVIFTIGTAFTNFGDGHRGTQAEAVKSIESNSVQPVAGMPEYYLSVAVKGDPATAPLEFLLIDPATKQVQIGTEKGLEPAQGAEVFANKVTKLDGYTILGLPQVIARQADLTAMTVPAGDGAYIKSQGTSRALAGKATLAYAASCDCVTDASTGKIYKADGSQGYFVADNGDHLDQGWQVNVGLTNWARPFQDPILRGHFVGTLIWTFVFAFLSVFLTFAVGLLLALALNSDKVKGLKLYRVLIVLPYAMPSFAMLLVWRDMFNKDFGLINTLFHLNVDWLNGPITAKIAILLVQIWMGSPYMFLVTTGALQSIPSDLVEAASVDGASSWFSFRTVTLPLLFVATAPLLISSFAFNFNNFNAIRLVTDGGPFPADSPMLGSTDLLISYTYRLAGFSGGGGAQYGLAAAMSIFIFLIIAIVSILGFKKTAVLEEVN